MRSIGGELAASFVSYRTYGLTIVEQAKGAIMNLHGFHNVLLRNLPPNVIDRLELVKVKLPTEKEIEYPGNEIRHLFFIEDGMASMTTTFLDGSQVEIGVAGYESVLGASSMLGTHRSLNRVYMQIEGWGYQSKMALGVEEFARHGDFHDLVLRYTQALFIQSSQTAGCNARHSIQQRLARWLLLCDERIGGKPLLLSQEFIAQMLGNRRTSVSVEAGKLQKLGLIRYKRGKVEILDREGLQRKSCECYRVVRDYLVSYAEGGGSGPAT
jgi:CRP-like cAMP-binding protein